MYYIGIDIGGTTVKGGIVKEDGTIMAKDAFDTDADAGYEVLVSDIFTFCQKLIDLVGISIEDIKSIGLGCPGTIDDKNGVVIYSNNINLKDAPVVAEFKKYIQKPVYINNDANCAALGEYFAMGDSSVRDFVEITLGTGVGSGVIIDGKLFSGFDGAGAELGHMVITMDGQDCTCGRKGCWEAYASATALNRDALRAARSNPSSLLAKLIAENQGNVNGRLVWEAAAGGDKTAIEVTKTYAIYVAEGICNIINIFRPQIIAIGGGISRAGDALLTPVKEYVNARYYGVGYVEPPRIVTARLGNDAGIIGAAFLGR